jgi:hypothetical protein
MAVLDALYDDYGDTPKYRLVATLGNDYLRRMFPEWITSRRHASSAASHRLRETLARFASAVAPALPPTDAHSARSTITGVHVRAEPRARSRSASAYFA